MLRVITPVRVLNVLRKSYFPKLRFVPPCSEPKLFLCCSTNSMTGSLNESFEEAKKKLSSLTEEVGNDIKLKLYALYKQSTVGPCNSKKPSAFDFVGKAKWEAWNSLASITEEEAKRNYISLIESLLQSNSSPKNDVVSANHYEGILYTVEDGVTKVTYNRPQKKNAFTTQMYRDIPAALKAAAENDTAVTVITGNGDYFSSGNDLNNFTSMQGDIATAAQSGADLLRSFVASFIDFPKVLVAAVNGPAVGIPVTLLGLFDFVYASDKATFQTPFSVLGQSPEGCSTYTFPKIMGYAKANEVLLFNKKLTAFEAEQLGLVTGVFPSDVFNEEVSKRLKQLTEMSKNSLIFSKQLSRDIERSVLHKVNNSECDRLVERWQSPDCMDAIIKFLGKKGKL